MKIVRTILAVAIGFLVSVISISLIEFISWAMYKPADAPGMDDMAKIQDYLETLQKDPQRMGDWLKSLPTEAYLIVLASWQAGAFFGGLASALIAGRSRCIHAGIIGGLVLAFSVWTIYDLKQKYDVMHPNWMILAALLLPLPVSLLAGKLVSMVFPPSATSP